MSLYLKDASGTTVETTSVDITTDISKIIEDGGSGSMPVEIKVEITVEKLESGSITASVRAWALGEGGGDI